MSLTPETAAIVKGLLDRGEKQHDIAAFFGVNGGRIAEIKTGMKFAEVPAAPGKDLPKPADLSGDFAIYQARQAILRAKIGLEAALSYLNSAELGRESFERAQSALPKNLRRRKRGEG